MAARNFGRVNVSITASTGGLTAGLGNASKQMKGFASQTQGLGGLLTRSLAGFVGLGNGATIASIGIKALTVAIQKLLGPLVIVTSLVGLFARLGQTATDLDRVGKAARRLGLATNTLQAFEGVASEAGVSSEKVATMVTFMNRQIGEAANGSKTAQKQFERLGLSLDDFAGLGTAERFELIAQRIQALPFDERASAAMLFGRAGAEGLNLISAAAGGALTDMQKLQEQLGVSLTTEQVAGIEMMNDALARTSLVFQGFINQFLAELAPAITTVANLFVRFFAENTQGWSIAKTLGYAFGQMLRQLVGYWTVLYGAAQLVFAFYSKGFSIMMSGVSLVIKGFSKLNSVLLNAAEAIGLTSVATQLRRAQTGFDKLSRGTSAAAKKAADDAAAAWTNGLENITNPFAAYDAEFAKVTDEMEKAGAAGGQAFGDVVDASLKASTQALKAIVVGTSAGEEFRNSILRGADPRLEGDKNEERTADATERTADAVEDLALSMGDGLGLATIVV